MNTMKTAVKTKGTYNTHIKKVNQFMSITY